MSHSGHTSWLGSIGGTRYVPRSTRQCPVWNIPETWRRAPALAPFQDPDRRSVCDTASRAAKHPPPCSRRSTRQGTRRRALATISKCALTQYTASNLWVWRAIWSRSSWHRPETGLPACRSRNVLRARKLSVRIETGPLTLVRALATAYPFSTFGPAPANRSRSPA